MMPRIRKRYEAKFNKWKWIIIYFLSIILFAYIYTALPLHFYHMTTQYEPQLVRLCNQVKLLIEEDLKENFRARYSEGAAYLDDENKWICHADSIHVEEFTYENNVPTISIAIDLIKNIEGQILKIGTKYETVHTEMKVTLQKSYLKTAEGVTLVGKIQREPLKEELLQELTLDKISHENIFYKNLESDLVGIKFSNKTFEEIESYGMAMRGFPTNVKGNFLRMLYLSMMTITGLGFGDIVPITSSARTLIGIEAVWGIVLLALFGNDIMKNKV